MKYSKTTATLFSLLLIILVSSPLSENWQQKPKDSFPLSYYPMFSLKRGKTHSLYHIVGYDKAENRYVIPYKYVGSGGLNQVRRQINKICRKGEGDKLARKVAKRLAKKTKVPFSRLERVEVIRATYTLEDYFLHDNQTPKKERVIASQQIKRQ